MKRISLILASVLIFLLSGCSQENGILKIFGQSDSSAPKNQMTIIWLDGSQEKVDRAYSDEESKVRFVEKCGDHYKITFDDEGLATLKCTPPDEHQGHPFS